MDIAFVPVDSHDPARGQLDDLLSKGTGRILIACAFCSGAGVVIMRRHVARLRAPGSCLVVSGDNPTDIAAVNDLARQAPGAVWMHKTGKLPNEKQVGTALMHSKVFYAEAGDQCWLWVGSHNLTARATAGANLEAAILLAGHPSEGPFEAARRHIEACRQESSPCPMEPPPLPDGENVDVVIVHAETDELPSGPSLWHVRLGLRSAEYDWSLRPVADVRLHLYKRGDLARGWRYALPWASYAGTLTGLNFTNVHPDTPGIPAVWSDEHYSITEEPSALRFSKASPRTDGIVTQAVINIQSLAPANEAFLPAKPKAARDEQTERRILGWTDEDISTFFTSPSIRDGHLVYEIRHQGEASWSLSIGDLRESDQLKLNEDAERRRIGLLDVVEEKRARHPLIMRAKYKLA